MSEHARLPVAVVLSDEDYGVELFANSIGRLAVDSIVCAPAGPGLVLLAFDVERDPARYLDLVCCLSAYNGYLRQLCNGDVAGIYDGLLHYEERNIVEGRETMQSTSALFARRSGDCADLVAARCSEPEARAAGATPKINLVGCWPDGGCAYHMTVQYPSGTIEDPSALLGMPVHQGTEPSWHFPSSP